MPDGGSWDYIPMVQKLAELQAMPKSAISSEEVEVVVLPVESDKAEIWKAWAWHMSDYEEGPDVLDVKRFFPGGCCSIMLSQIPGTHHVLPFTYRVYFTNFSKPERLNIAYNDIFGKPWVGNIVIAKYGRYNSNTKRAYANIQRTETEILIVLAGMWLQGLWDRTFGPIPDWKENYGRMKFN